MATKGASPLVAKKKSCIIFIWSLLHYNIWCSFTKWWCRKAGCALGGVATLWLTGRYHVVNCVFSSWKLSYKPLIKVVLSGVWLYWDPPSFFWLHNSRAQNSFFKLLIYFLYTSYILLIYFLYAVYGLRQNIVFNALRQERKCEMRIKVMANIFADLMPHVHL